MYAELPPSYSEFVDSDVVACRTYYYDITAVDQCGNGSVPLPSTQSGYSTTQEVPAQPTGLVAEPTGPTFNSLHWDRVTVNGAGSGILVDTYRVLHPDAAESGTASGFRGRRNGAKIDHVLVAAGAATIREASIVRTAVDGRYPSDHFPVTAILEWP